MRRVLMVMALVTLVAAPVFAQVVKEATGTVDSIDPIDPPRGDYDGGIILKNTDSPVTSFDITTATVISDQSTGKIDSGDIQDGDKVRVTYSESDKAATAITILRIESNYYPATVGED
jgi:hypothetical protein